MNENLQNDYNAGYGAGDRGAAVAKPSDGTFDADVQGRTGDAYGDAPDGSDGGCFVEVVILEDGGGNVPYRETFGSATSRIDYRDVWFENAGQDNYIYICGAAYHDSVGDGKLGVANHGYNYIYVYEKMINNHPLIGASDVSQVNPDTTAHEIGHQFDLGQTDNNHPSGVWCHEGPNTDYCLMSYERDRTDDISEFGHDPSNGVSHLLEIRDAADGL